MLFFISCAIHCKYSINSIEGIARKTKLIVCGMEKFILNVIESTFHLLIVFKAHCKFILILNRKCLNINKSETIICNMIYYCSVSYIVKICVGKFLIFCSAYSNSSLICIVNVAGKFKTFPC